MNPARASNVRATGSWNMMPKPRIKVMTSDRYSLIFASSWIGIWPSVAGTSKLAKNFSANGRTR